MILIVASHADTRAALGPLISSRGYPVTAVDCDDALLKWVRFQPPRLVILDCDLPASFKTLATIRSDPRTAPIPVVLYSDDTKLKEKALAKGANAFVPKGALDWAELFTHIHHLAGPPSPPAAS